MKKLLVAAFATVLFNPLAGAQSEIVAQRLGYPQMIVHNGKIVTMDDDTFEARVGTIVQAMAIRDGKILATGSNAEIRSLAGPRTKTIDLKGRTVLPGFILTHEHPTDWAFQHPRAIGHVLPDDNFLIHRWLPGGPAKQQLAAFSEIMPQAIAKARPGQWILLSFNRYGPDGRDIPGVQELFHKNITKTWLDLLAPDNPVKVKSGFNDSVINQKAIEELRKVHPTLSVISGNAENSTPGFTKWLESGVGFNRPVEPNVMFKDNLPALASVLKAEMELWTSWGATTFGSSPYAYRNLQAFDFLDKRGEMPGRFGWAYTGPDWGEETLRYLSALQGHGTDNLWFVGAWGRAGTNCMSIPLRPEWLASQDREANTDQRPCAFTPGGEFWKRMETIIGSGLRIATMYAFGDKDIDFLMDVIEKAGKDAGLTLDDIRAKRHTFDGGGGAPRPDQIARMKQLGMMATLFNGYLDDGGASRIAKMYGVEYANWVVPRMSLTKAGVMSTNGVDAPIPRVIFREILKGMTRYDDKDQKVYAPSERAGLAIQLKAFTRWGAYYMLREDLLGTLEPGKFADFIVLDRDILTIPEDEIPRTQVLLTSVGGKVVHLTHALGGEIGMVATGPSTWKENIPPGW